VWKFERRRCMMVDDQERKLKTRSRKKFKTFFKGELFQRENEFFYPVFMLEMPPK
jgi:hypothetical protein